MKYLLYIDYRATSGLTQEYKPMEAKNFREAIEEADAMHDIDKMYLIRIMEKAGKVMKEEEGCKSQLYKAIECKRNTRWYPNTKENNERNHVVKRYYMASCEWYEAQ